MFFLIGWNKHSRDLGPVGEQTCAHCHNTTRWRRVELSNRLTLFFIPILTTGRSRWDICPICQRGFEVPAE
ncbi:zinc-ribbon domain-containing protein [bacterium CG17_big_fil_post_rev_8_21_14_2_50_64_8]|nr:MAG: zinc-ribbon domain-containing protein [bacterium CG17_big_fil_post_rev_8_21_14_2_50_64_8]PJA73417.1 MAG: zinc-ribbon domain-containing protein [bacterium CG_4_9_14_3_um_filter_65_15]